MHDSPSPGRRGEMEVGVESVEREREGSREERERQMERER